MTQHAFTAEEASRGGQRSVQVRQARALNRATRARQVHDLITAVDSGSIGQEALEASLELIGRLRDTLPNVTVESPLDVARVAEAAAGLHKLYRLETGQSTSNAAVATGTVDAAAIEQQRAELMARLAEAQQPPAE